MSEHKSKKKADTNPVKLSEDQQTELAQAASLAYGRPTSDFIRERDAFIESHPVRRD
jgi:hypothetical protein